MTQTTFIPTAETAETAAAPCLHPPAQLFCWFASDASAPKGTTLVICCKACHTVLQGGSTL